MAGQVPTMTSLNAELTQIMTWEKTLQETATDGTAVKPHGYICFVSDGSLPQRRIKVVTFADYKAYSSGNRDKFIECQKLTIQQIFDTSEKFMNSSYIRKISLSITHLIYFPDPSTTDDELIRTITNAMDAVDAIRRMPLPISKMIKSLEAKRLQDANSSLFGKVMWYFSSDLTPKINAAVEQMPKARDVFNNVLEDVKERILMNMDSFEREAKVLASARNNFDDKDTKNTKFSSPKDIKGKWLTLYAPDKLQKKVSQTAKDNLLRVNKFIILWERMLQRLNIDTEEEKKTEKV